MSVIAQLQSKVNRASIACRSIVFGMFAAITLMLNGCQTLSLPAIDTTGNRIFDLNRSIQWVNPHDPNNGYPSTAPAFQQPPTPPKCVQSGDKKLCQGCLGGKGCLFGQKQASEEMRGRCGELLITPNRLVAPVGGEVVILAGICGEDDNLVTNEAIEWMVAPGSVGQIVEVGDDAKGKRSSSFWSTSTGPKVEKLGVDFARGRTSKEAGVITKGTADQTDDLPIRKGQTWASLTSPSEGITKVTVLAPDSEVWDKRRQTATIYWIDASWNFPLPLTVSGDEPAMLSTKVLRSDNFKAAKGWIVRYRSLNPEFAKFQQVTDNGVAPMLVDTVDATVDNEGIAKVLVKRLDSTDTNYSVAKNGTALIEVEIVRPAQASEDMPDLSLAKANTSVTWAAPELVLEAIGPDRLAPGQQSRYVMKVYNIGSMPADNLSLTMTFPTSLFQVNTTSFAASRQTDQALIWDSIGRLEARSEITIAVDVTAITAGDAKVTFDLIASPNIRQQKTIDTSVIGDSVSLVLTPKPGMDRVVVNGQVFFDCVITNNSGRALNDVNVQLQSTPGLVHLETGKNQVEQRINQIAPGVTERLGPMFFMNGVGRQQLTATVTVMGNIVGTSTAVVEGIPGAAPSPGTQQPGTQIPGSPQPGLPSEVMPNSNLPDILPGGGAGPGSGTIPVLPTQPTMPGIPPTDILPTPGAPGSNELPVNPVLPGMSGQSSARPAIGSGVASQDRLAVSVQPLQQAIRRGDVVTYEIRVDNLVSQPDSRVVIAFAVPKGGSLEKVKAQGLEYRMISGGAIVEMTPIQFFRARDSYTLQVQIKHGDSPSQLIVASAKSQNQPTAVSNSINVRAQ